MSDLADEKDFSLPKAQVKSFAGVCLGGGKTDRTAVSVLDFYPQYEKLFLTRLYSKIGAEGDKSSDHFLYNILAEKEKNVKIIGFDVPLALPKCMRCTLKCPGYEKCKLPEIKWMWGLYNKRTSRKKPNKIFTPYTERCVDMFLTGELEEPFNPSHALGSNAAPLTARAHFIQRRLLKKTFIEVHPKLTLWRIGNALKIQKSYLRFHKHAMDSHESREFLLNRLRDEDILFIYDQDFKTLIDDVSAFDSLLVALTCYLKFQKQTERPPANFPKLESWVEYPIENPQWNLKRTISEP